MNALLHQEERDTIAERLIPLKLSTADVRRLAERAATVGLTASELLESFIGDLVGGTHYNGSDERHLANCWLERCGFEYTARKSFLRYLTDMGSVDYLLELWEDYRCSKGIVNDDYSEDITDEDRAFAKEDMDDFMMEITESYEEYRSWAGGEAAPLEDEMAELVRWKTGVDQLTKPCAQEQPPASGELAESKSLFTEPDMQPTGPELCGDAEWEP